MVATKFDILAHRTHTCRPRHRLQLLCWRTEQCVCGVQGGSGLAHARAQAGGKVKGEGGGRRQGTDCPRGWAHMPLVIGCLAGEVSSVFAIFRVGTAWARRRAAGPGGRGLRRKGRVVRGWAPSRACTRCHPMHLSDQTTHEWPMSPWLGTAARGDCRLNQGPALEPLNPFFLPAGCTYVLNACLYAHMRMRRTNRTCLGEGHM